MSIADTAGVLAEIALISGGPPLNDPQQKTSFQITKLPVHIGRDNATNDFVISHSSISRNHAEVSRENGIWSIKNLTANRDVPNKLSVNGQEVWQQSLHNNDVIGLGNEMKLRFATSMEEEPYDINQIITQINYNPSALVTGPVVAEKKVGVGPFNSFEHPAWSAVGTLTGIAGLLALVEQAVRSSQELQFVTGILISIVCIMVLVFEQVKYLLPAFPKKEVAPILPIVTVPAKRNVQRWLLRTFIINIVLLVALAIVINFSYSRSTDSFGHEWGIFLFGLGLLIAFISFLVTISNLMLKKMLKKRRVLWMLGVVFILGLCLLVFGSNINNPGIGFSALVVDGECIVVFVITLFIALIIRIQALEPQGEKKVV